MGTAILKSANLAVANSAADVVQHVNNMRIETTVAKLAMDEISDTVTLVLRKIGVVESVSAKQGWFYSKNRDKPGAFMVDWKNISKIRPQEKTT